MRRKRLIWQLFPSYIFITLVAILAITFYLVVSFRGFYEKQTASELTARTKLVIDVFRRLVTNENFQRIDELCKTFGRNADTRLTVILPNGVVVGDSETDITTMDNHSTRPEIMAALKGGVGHSNRFSETLQSNMIYVALPLLENEKIIGVLRSSVPSISINNTLRSLYAKLFQASLIVLIFSILMSYVVSKRLSRPLEEMRLAAEQFAKGELGRRVVSKGSAEMQSLADAMNDMAIELSERILSVESHQNQTEAVLSSMVEGVIAFDPEQKVMMLNGAAAKLLNVTFQEVEGYPLWDFVENERLKEFIDLTVASGEPVEGEIVLPGDDGERYWQCHGTTMRDTGGNNIGALVVLNDVTRLRRLEKVRRDFVANVSHELKTPVTSIKGFVETLLDGALEDKDNTQRFLRIVSKQADRLNSIIIDLLTLSRIEQEAEAAEIAREQSDLRELIEAAVQVCEPRAKANNVQIESRCTGKIQAKINMPLLEQALINLVDNAVKYSGDGARVTIEAAMEKSHLLIQVSDTGPGIPKDYLPRIFERFYRIDKARSREMGGTGLGLSIVKHIVKVHGGSIDVESEIGEGSVFTIRVPLA